MKRIIEQYVDFIGDLGPEVEMLLKDSQNLPGGLGREALDHTSGDGPNHTSP